MRKTCLNLPRNWRRAVALFCCLGAGIAFAQNGRQVGTVSAITAVNMRCGDLVDQIRRMSGATITLQAEPDALVNLRIDSPIPVEQALRQLCQQIPGLTVQTTDDGFVLSKRETTVAVIAGPAIDPIPVNSVQPPVVDAGSMWVNPGIELTSGAAPTPPTPTKKEVIRRIDLFNMGARDLAWMLGVKGVDLADANRKKVMQQRIRTLFEPRDTRYIARDPGADGGPAGYSTTGSGNGYFPGYNPLINPAGSVGLRNNSTTPMQYVDPNYGMPYGGGGYGASPYGGGANPYGGGGYGASPYGASPYGGSGYGASPYGGGGYGASPYGGGGYGAAPYGGGGYAAPYSPYGGGGYPAPVSPYGGVNPANPTWPPAPTNPTTPGTTDPNDPTGGALSTYVPKGIKQIVGLLGLNALLVMSEDEESMKQFEALIKALDQPVKQVIVKVEFVKMEVKDAMSLSSAWEFANTPFSIVNNNDFGAVTGGNFLTRYVKGNLRVALGSLITDHKAEVINSPLVIVPNGGQASFMMEDSVPFIYMNEETDIFGRTYSTPTVYLQVFSQGLVVQDVVISPNDTVRLRIDPILEAPLGSVELPGGGGTSASIMGTSKASIDTTVTVKSGETIVMGGFISKDNTSDSTRAPLLSNLPIIGPILFGGKKTMKSCTQVMIFVTPIVVKDDTTDFGRLAMPSPLW